MKNHAMWAHQSLGIAEQVVGGPLRRGMAVLPGGLSLANAGAVGPTARKPCQYWLLPRGCAKGEGCDFLHSRPCSFFNSDAGCIKAELCDFHHVKSADLDEKVLERIREHKDRIHSRPCPFFNSPGGCNKGDQCGFTHAGQAAALPDASHVGANQVASFDTRGAERIREPKHHLSTPSVPAAAPNVAGGGRVCTFFNTPRGCIKGAKCDFEHPNLPAVAPSVAGGGRVCTFFNTPRGCIKGAKCDFEHPDLPATTPGAAGAIRVCTYFNTPRGCIKGAKCDFEHVDAPSAHLAGMQASAGLPASSYGLWQFNFNPATLPCSWGATVGPSSGGPAAKPDSPVCAAGPRAALLVKMAPPSPAQRARRPEPGAGAGAGTVAGAASGHWHWQPASDSGCQ